MSKEANKIRPVLQWAAGDDLPALQWAPAKHCPWPDGHPEALQWLYINYPTCMAMLQPNRAAVRGSAIANCAP